MVAAGCGSPIVADAGVDAGPPQGTCEEIGPTRPPASCQCGTTSVERCILYTNVPCGTCAAGLECVANTCVASDAGVADAGSMADGGIDAGASWLRLAPGTSWQWQLTGTIDTSIDAGVFDIDLFEAPQATIDQLHASGRKVICYFDTAYEDFRPDSAQLAPYRGNPVDGWPGQYWVDFRQSAVRAVMSARLDLAVMKRCDAVEPDDVDAIDNSPGFPITANDQLDFCRFLATEAHARGLGVALKNNLAQVPQLVSDFDFAVNEECFQYAECDELLPFIQAGKAVLQVEYSAGRFDTKAAQICPQANAKNFDTLIKHLDLGSPRRACR